MHPALIETSHRPWEMPAAEWRWQQQWDDLAFLHWEISPAVMQETLPEDLEIDTYDGRAWLGVVPFDMKGVAPRGCPRFKALSDFPEINVRTYVIKDGKPGVWFYSLDVPNPLAVWAARRFFHLPYFRASMQVQAGERGIDYRSARGKFRFDASYRPTGPASFSAGSFEIWATERYCLYTANRAGRTLRAEVQHGQWPLETAEIEMRENTMLHGFTVGDRHPSVLFSRHLDVVVWPLEGGRR